jgi:RNA polymerase sigma factor FliA
MVPEHKEGCTLNGLLKAYQQETVRDTHAARNELVASHLYLVKFVVDRIASSLPPHLDRDDLRSVAIIGLISAAERFDAGRGIQFKSFAERRIKGSILDELRDQDWLTRSQRDKLKQLEHEFSRLEQQLGRSPSGDEVAHAMGLSIDDYYRILDDINFFAPISLNAECNDGTGTPFSLQDILEDTSCINPQSKLIDRQTVEQLAGLIENLPEKERLVVALYYYEELNLREIGAVLEVTESRVSQLHSHAIMTLRTRMKFLSAPEGQEARRQKRNLLLTPSQETATTCHFRA